MVKDRETQNSSGWKVPLEVIRVQPPVQVRANVKVLSG